MRSPKKLNKRVSMSENENGSSPQGDSTEAKTTIGMPTPPREESQALTALDQVGASSTAAADEAPLAQAEDAESLVAPNVEEVSAAPAAEVPAAPAAASSSSTCS